MGTQYEEQRFYSRLISLADTLVADFDVVGTANELVHDCAEFLSVGDAGIIVENQQCQLQVLASTSEETRLLELVELQSSEGPCLDAFRTGATVRVHDLLGGRRWPTFRAHALALGFKSAYAVPLQLHGTTIGAVNLFSTAAHGLGDGEMQAAHRLAAMATLGILTHRTVQRHELLAEQLQHALDVRVVVEQAKGIVAERAGVTVSTALELLRSAARSTRRPLADVACDVIQGRLPALGPTARSIPRARAPRPR